MTHTRAAHIAAALTIAAALALSTPSVAEKIVREDSIERMVIIDGESLDGWQVTEASLKPSAEHARSGKAMLFEVPIDWHGGEKKYPIGWPRCWLPLKPPQDWSKWDRLSLWIYADYTRDTLPSRPLGLIITTKEYGGWQRSLDTLAKGEWRHFVFPLDTIPGRDKVVEIKFFISEAYYHDKETVRFFIDDFELIRYTRPTVVSIEPLARVCYADEPAMPVEVEVLGVPGESTVQLTLRLEAAGRALLETTRAVPRGRCRLALRLPKGLKPGVYKLVAAVGDTTASAPLRLVDSPWQ